MINEKYPGGLEGQKVLLEKEGHVVVQKGRRLAVKDFKERLVDEDGLFVSENITLYLNPDRRFT